MKHRYHIRNHTHFAEFPFSPEGHEAAKAFRRNHPEFKRRWIRDVIQAFPSRVPEGVKMALG